MFDLQLANHIGLSDEEIKIFKEASTPVEFQELLLGFPYLYEEHSQATFPSARRALREKKVHCFSGALLGAAYVILHRLGPPLMLCIEARDIDHNLAVYWQDGAVGSIGASRQIELIGKPPTFLSYRDLVLSYYQDFYNEFTKDRNDITMRGYCAPFDLRLFDYAWINSEADLEEIENFLYRVPYRKLFPEKPNLYSSPPTIDAGDNLYYSPRQ